MTAKNEATEMTVEQKLKTLFELQTMLSEIDKIKTLRGELPLEVGDLEDEIEGLSTRLAKYNEALTATTDDIKAKQQKIVDAQAIMDRYKSQLNDVKNNREFDMLSKEIEFQSLEIELQNKRIGEAEKLLETKKADIAALTKQLADRRDDLEVKKSELDEITAETKVEEENLREEATLLEVPIAPRLLTAFKRIRNNTHNGLGIVYVERDACGGCFNKIPPQRQLDIRMRKKIIVCEYCGRIMIDPELAGVETIQVESEKPKRRTRKATK